ncbi:transposase [Plantactinospora sp. KBS50]|uniref:transposase n=1 Tax=Plantactinospora sp. KBS50 TaxID=2024580 RepID=UPI000BAB0391|nr:transposase [Plantactinospora sp. KBS50]ASW56730.1 transposase [Plantactinospora sp. KBS50]
MSGEEDDHVALVRVYCGLALSDRTARPAPGGPVLTAAVVDDAGRLISVRDISDEPAGYARLGSLLAERSSGPGDAAVAADSDDHVIVSLLSVAGRPVAIADDDAVDDFAERFADDDSLEEMNSPPAERRAVGLARALQAGAISAVTMPTPRDLAEYKPVLAAHAALATGRHAAAAALREVLRDLYPAALRAYPDPAAPVALAVLDALPEPSMLDSGARSRSGAVMTEAIVTHLAADRIAEPAVIEDAVTALRVAITETPRRTTNNKEILTAAAETVRHAVAAVRACDAGCTALVNALAERVAPPPTPTLSRLGRRAAAEPAPAHPGAVGAGRTQRRPVEQGRQFEDEPVPAVGRRRQPEPATGSNPPVAPRPVAPPPVAPAPAVSRPSVAPAASAGAPASRAERFSGGLDQPPAAYRPDGPVGRPVSAPPPPPPGIMPIAPGQRGGRPPAENGEPFRATLTTAAINSARAERRPTPIPSRGTPPERRPAATNGSSATDFSLPMPAARPAGESAPPPGSRGNWPLVNGADEHTGELESRERPRPYPDSHREPDRHRDEPTGGIGGGRNGRVPPPWLADDLPQEPPMLRLVEPPPLADRALRDDLARRPEPAADLPRRPEPAVDAPPLRLVEPRPEPARSSAGRPAARSGGELDGLPQLPVADDGDGDLLIFAAARSAWFTGHPEEDEVDWSSTADSGWRAAEQAAKPSIGSETTAGLPKRVPQANLVPGSPLREERPLRIVRNAASLAENTTGYFRGWRRGQEIGGYAVGGRPGRESAGGWDFTRDQDDSDRDYQYRSAGYRS